MNTQQLRKCMLSDKHIQAEMGGVFAVNNLPIIVTDKPKIYIVNLDPSHLPGSHWTAIYCLEDGTSEFFDSLANPPTNTIASFLLNNGPNYCFSNRKTQGEKPVCGEFCLFWSYYRTRGFSYQNILNMWTDNLYVNDLDVSFFVHKHFPI